MPKKKFLKIQINEIVFTHNWSEMTKITGFDRSIVARATMGDQARPRVKQAQT